MTRIRIDRACSEPWDGMKPTGPDARHCASCARDVIDLSTLTRREAEARLASQRESGGRVCIRADVDARGDAVFRRPRRSWQVLLLAAALLGCAEERPPTRRARSADLHDVAIRAAVDAERERADRRARSASPEAPPSEAQPSEGQPSEGRPSALSSPGTAGRRDLVRSLGMFETGAPLAPARPRR